VFAGCGGLSSGVHQSNNRQFKFEPISAVEIDVDAAATYSLNVSDRVFCGDVSDWLKSDEFPDDDIDVVLGGPPCQGFSSLGKQQSTDRRNSLWGRYVATVQRLRPKIFLLENVAQFLLSSQFNRFKNECRPSGRLSDYAIEVFVLDASLYGAPQRRRRAIVIGRHRDIPELGPPPALSVRTTVRDAFSTLSIGVSDVDLPARHFEYDGISLSGPFQGRELHLTRRVSDQSRLRYATIPEGGNRFDLPYELQAPCWRKHKTGAGDVMGRLRWDQPSVTIRTEFFKPEKGRYLHPEANRPITHLEASRLQGFPDSYLWCGGKASIARQIGNAVPLQLGAALGRHIAGALRGFPSA